MNGASPYSATIERMRHWRNVPTFENRRTWTPIPIAPPTPTRIHPRLRDVRRVLRRFLGLRNATEIHAALEDIQTLLIRCGYHLHLLRTERLWKRRDGKRAYRDPHLHHLKRQRGRPVDGVNLAYHQLGLGLAEIWFTYTGRRPGRCFDSIGDKRDGGPLLGICRPRSGVLPTRLRMKRKGHLPRNDTFVRASIEAFKASRNAEEEHRRRGLIDEQRWLDGHPRRSPGDDGSK